MTAYHLLALPVAERRELTKSAYFGEAWNALKGGLRQTRDNVWNAGARGLGQMKQDATNGLKSMAATAQTAVDNGIDKGLNFVNNNISKPMYGAAGAIYNGAQQAVQGAQHLGQQAVQGAQQLGNQAVQGVQQAGQAVATGAQNLGQQAVDTAKGAWAGAQNAADSAIDGSLNFVNNNISKPMYGAIGGAISEGLRQHGGPGPWQPQAPASPQMASAQ